MSWIYYHNLDPYLIRFSNGVGIRWYGLAYLGGFFLGYLLVRWQIRRGWIRLTPADAADLTFYTALCGVVGGRVGYVFLYGLPFFLDNPLYLFEIWEGGMSIHGGVVGAVVGIGLFARSRGESFWSVSDAAALATPPGLFLGRLANFVNGELWGRPTEGNWGVKFPQEMYSWGYVKLEELRQTLTALDVVEDGNRLLTQRQLQHVVHEIQQGNPKYLQAVDPLLPARHPSQLYEAVVEGPLLFLVLLWVRFRYRRVGFLSVVFLIGYGVARFFVEFTRAPDPHVGYEFLGLTRGQEYSLVFVGMGLLIEAWFRLGGSRSASPDASP